MWWKIYFWYLSASLIIMAIFIPFLPTLSSFTFADWRGIVESVIVAIGAYAYIFRRKIFLSQVWRIVFWCITIFWILDFLYLFFGEFLKFLHFFLQNSFTVQVISGGKVGVIMSIIFGLPGLYAIYKLAYKNKKH
jgi:hypothetical protein